jgi:formate hydrogenlyase subunit 6/NADH:ubiquinone oxidoreductase subunit I
MKKAAKIVLPADLCAVACPAEAITMEGAERLPGEEIYTAKKNMQRNTRSICCVVFSAGCVKKPVRKMRSI